jgi:DNA-directed RNA polymerase specialized sigma24 family protein
MVNDRDNWQTATRICTPQQLTALQLHTKGLSYRTIALHLGISQQRAHQLVDRALQKIELELRKEPAA